MIRIWIATSLFLGFVQGAFADAVIHLDHLQPLVNAKAQESLDGKVLLYFWASWCPDCRDKLVEAIPQLQKDFPAVKIVSINADRDSAKGKNFAESEKLTLPVYRDEEKSLTKELKLFAVPAWAFIEKSKSGEWTVKSSSTGSDLAEIRNQLKR